MRNARRMPCLQFKLSSYASLIRARRRRRRIGLSESALRSRQLGNEMATLREHVFAISSLKRSSQLVWAHGRLRPPLPHHPLGHVFARFVSLATGATETFPPGCAQASRLFVRQRRLCLQSNWLCQIFTYEHIAEPWANVSLWMGHSFCFALMRSLDGHSPSYE